MASIESFIHRKVVVLPEDATARQAARAMCERAIGCVVVSNHQGNIIGIVTDRDLTCTLVANSSGGEGKLSLCMTSPIITVNEDTELEVAIQLMEIHGIRRIPVVRTFPSGIQKCIGIITLDDLIASRSISEYPLIRIIKSQILRRIHQHQGKSAILHLADYRTSRLPIQRSSEEFYREVSACTGLQDSPWASQFIRGGIKLVIEMLLMRLHHTGAVNLLSQLPQGFQDEFLSTTEGPDRTVTLSRILSEFEKRFGMDSKLACEFLAKICEALNRTLESERFEHVKHQLPEEFHRLFRHPIRMAA